MTRKLKLTEDEKLRRRAAKKADARNAKLVAQAGPLFADQIPAEEFTNADDEYWRQRQSWAHMDNSYPEPPLQVRLPFARTLAKDLTREV